MGSLVGNALWVNTSTGEISKTGQREKVGGEAVTAQDWSIPWWCSGAGMALQDCPEFRQHDQSSDVR